MTLIKKIRHESPRMTDSSLQKMGCNARTEEQISAFWEKAKEKISREEVASSVYSDLLDIEIALDKNQHLTQDDTVLTVLFACLEKNNADLPTSAFIHEELFHLFNKALQNNPSLATPSLREKIERSTINPMAKPTYGETLKQIETTPHRHTHPLYTRQKPRSFEKR